MKKIFAYTFISLSALTVSCVNTDILDEKDSIKADMSVVTNVESAKGTYHNSFPSSETKASAEYVVFTDIPTVVTEDKRNKSVVDYKTATNVFKRDGVSEITLTPICGRTAYTDVWYCNGVKLNIDVWQTYNYGSKWTSWGKCDKWFGGNGEGAIKSMPITIKANKNGEFVFTVISVEGKTENDVAKLYCFQNHNLINKGKTSPWYIGLEDSNRDCDHDFNDIVFVLDYVEKVTPVINYSKYTYLFEDNENASSDNDYNDIVLDVEETKDAIIFSMRCRGGNDAVKVAYKGETIFEFTNGVDSKFNCYSATHHYSANHKPVLTKAVSKKGSFNTTDVTFYCHNASAAKVLIVPFGTAYPTLGTDISVAYPSYPSSNWFLNPTTDVTLIRF